MSSPSVLLEIAGVQKRYGGVHALRGVDFSVRAGEVHALVGENGAGKSTLIKIVSGAESPDTGQVSLDGKPLSLGSTSAALDAGIATVYQEPQLFGELTVAENVFIGRELRRFGRVDWPKQRTQVASLLRRLGLDPRLADVRVADVPVAEQQLVSIAKAFAHDARILILDEPSAILTDREIETLFTVVRGLRDSGMGVIYISHRLDELAQVTDRVTVLRDGQVVASQPTRELSVRQVAELMVGQPLSDLAGKSAASAQGSVPALSVRDLSRGEAFTDVTFDVRTGEVVALYGLVGSGAGDIARALFGIDTAFSGTVSRNGKVITLADPIDAVRHGIAMLPANRKLQGVFAPQSIAFNISSAHLTFLSRLRLWVDRRREQATATDLISRMGIKAPGPGTAVGTLSGGNQQKVVLARQLVERPDVLVLQEPTQGVDVGAKEEIHRTIASLAEAGSAVVLVSSDLQEVLLLADRLLVVRAGRITARYGRAAEQVEVLAAAAGEVAE
ncbi:sugar ABC transporter ATP-binding protein [Fodinicola feengrottensis]|uniref:Sugar ABC transporter ATP-binding protein n=1 Tax=Fodinicola feengrottensis TaxID=435914 RepID=A0ABP4SGW9_9ACTN